jgi:phosphoribosylamine---glycine ligase
MNVVVIGNGGREYAIASAISESERLEELYVLPGNAGTEEFATNVPLDINDNNGILDFCLAHEIDLVVIGPEAPLANGLSDVLLANHFAVFGPRQATARLETSKSYAKNFMQKHHIPTAASQTVTTFEEAVVAIDTLFNTSGVVIKADGLAAGKGVVVAATKQEALDTALLFLNGEYGVASQTIVVEECLTGPEISFLCLLDGKSVNILPPAADHKRLLDGDLGPNTGGMGAFAPTPLMDETVYQQCVEQILFPFLKGLQVEELDYNGVIFFGLMLTATGPKVLEFNCRFGDPETQVILPLLDNDILELFLATAEGRLSEIPIQTLPGVSVGVVLAAEGYPIAPQKGGLIRGFKSTAEEIEVVYAGTKKTDAGVIVDGGRVLTVVAVEKDFETAIAKVYQNVTKFSFAGQKPVYRTDIAQKALV